MMGLAACNTISKVLGGVLVVLLASTSFADWTVTILAPGGSTTSIVNGINSGQQVGDATIGGALHGSIWNGTAGSWSSLTPPQFASSQCYGTNGQYQVGASVGYASLWRGTRESWVSLGAGIAKDVDGSIQVGLGPQGACLWQGTEFSRIYLTPPGSSSSSANAVHGDSQVGHWWDGSTERACLWKGTVASRVDLHPTWALDSRAYDVHGNQQVGYTREPLGFGATVRACYWTGTRQSWRSLHPQDFAYSVVNGVFEGRQVGRVAPVAQISSERAYLWRGDSISREDLHKYLPPEYANLRSAAHSIHMDGQGMLRIGGQVGSQAVMWSRQYDLIPVTSMTLFRGTLMSGNLASLAASDDNKYIARLGVVFSSSEAPIQVIFEGTAPTANPDTLDFVVDSKVSASNIEHRIEIYNFQTGKYEMPYERMGTTADTYAIGFTTGTNASAFVEPITRKVRSRMTFRALGPVLAFPWRCEIDRALWMAPSD